jgi:hypothetical protein
MTTWNIFASCCALLTIAAIIASIFQLIWKKLHKHNKVTQRNEIIVITLKKKQYNVVLHWHHCNGYSFHITLDENNQPVRDECIKKQIKDIVYQIKKDKLTLTNWES